MAVIEDDLPLRNLYLTKLELSGFSTRGASNGIDGLELTEAFQPDLILLDLLMPHMSGDEMLQQLRSKPWGANIRVVILTNISRDEAPHVLRFLSVDRYIVKAHYTPTQVIEVVDEVLRIKR